MTISLNDVIHFNNGAPYASSVVGVSEGLPRNARYKFTTTEEGASSVSLHFEVGAGNGTTPERVRFAITADPSAFAAANWTVDGTGYLYKAADMYHYDGSADIVLLPNTTYYLFIYPDTPIFGWVYWGPSYGPATMTMAGGAYSGLVAQDGTIGEQMILSVNRYNTDFTHKITYSVGSQSGTVYEGGELTVYWTPPMELCEQITTAVATTARLSITTYDSDGNQIGVPQTVSIRLLVPESVVPTVIASWQDKSGAYDSYLSLVQNVSALEVTAAASGSYGSTIVSTVVTLNGEVYSGGVIADSGEIDLTVTVTDSRGRTATDSSTLYVLEYNRPALTLTASRCDAGGTADDEGEYALITVTGALSLLGDSNSGSLVVSYQSEGGAENQMTVDSVSPVNSFWYEWVVYASSSATMRITATVTDTFATASRTMTLSVGYATMDFLAGGRGIAFGATATEEGFTCAMPARFTGGISFGSTLADLVYPVGSIYMSVNATSPATLFGGSWERIQDTFLLAAGSTYSAGDSGGEAEHAITVDELPSHEHDFTGEGMSHDHATFKRDPNAATYADYQDMVDAYGTGDSVYGFSPSMTASTSRKQMRTSSETITPSGTISSTGNDIAHNNMPPYLAVYVWKRTE